MLMKNRKTKKRIHGNARGLMMICRDIRRRWLQYGENRKNPVNRCKHLKKEEKGEVDHINPVGSRPRTWFRLGPYAEAMFENACQVLCSTCHFKKTKREREKGKHK